MKRALHLIKDVMVDDAALKVSNPVFMWLTLLSIHLN